MIDFSSVIGDALSLRLGQRDVLYQIKNCSLRKIVIYE